MKKSFCLGSFLVVLFLLSSIIPVYGFSIGIDPARIPLEAAPGTKVEGKIKVFNNDKSESQYFIGYAEDWVFSKEGGKDIKPAGSTPRSCAAWIKIIPSEFEVKGGSYTMVKYVIEVPKDVQGGYYALIFFETGLPKNMGAFTGAALKGRIGATLSVDIKGTTNPSGSVTSFVMSRPDEDKPLKFDLEFRNDGNVALWGKGNLQIVDAKGNVFWKSDLDNFNTMPGDTIKRNLEWAGKLDAGKYTATVSFDFGGNKPLLSEVPFEVIKAGELQKMTVTSARKKPLKVYLKFANSGNLNIMPEGEVKILNLKDVLVETLVVKNDLVLPDSSRVFTVLSQKILPKGKYKVIGTMKFEEQVSTKTSEVVVN